MRLITLDCPKCNAQLEVNSKLTRAYCNYCGCQLLIDHNIMKHSVKISNAHQAGFDFERGRMAAQNNTQELVKEVELLIKQTSDLNLLNERLEELSPQISILESEDKKLHSLVSRSIPYIVLIFFISLGFISLASRFHSIGLSLILFLLAILSFYSSKLVIAARSKKVSKSLAAKLQQQEDAEQQHAEISENYNICIIPKEYRSVRILKFIYKMLNSGRAVTIQQAINLYEDAEHKARLEALEQERIAIQKQQRDIQQQQLEEMEYAALFHDDTSSQSTSTDDEDDASFSDTLKLGGAILAGAFLLDLFDKD